MKVGNLEHLRKRIAIATAFAFLTSLLQLAQPQMFAPSANAAVVDTSTVGTTFDFALPNGPTWTGTDITTAGWRIFFSSSETGTATVAWPDNTTTSISLTAGEVASTYVSRTHYVSSTFGVQTAKVIGVTSTVPISMYGCNFVAAASDCTNFLPTPTWGTRHRLLYGKPASGNSKVTVFTSSSSTNISFTPATTISTNNGTMNAGQTYDFTISSRSAWALEINSSTSDFSGSLITSDAPIGVINGWECSSGATQFPGAGGACDTGAQVVPPVSSWGSSFYSVNYENLGTTGSGYRIVADQPNTEITITGDETESVTLQAGEIYQLHAFRNTGGSPHKSISITSNNPVLVAHWIFAGSYTSLEGSDNADVSMSYVTPFQQFLDSYVVANPTGFKASYLNVLAPASAISNLTLDGVLVDASQFRTIAGSTWKSAQIRVLKGTHILRAPQAFGVEVYGVGYFDSYAYTGGSNTSPLANVASLQLSSSNINGVVGQSACIPVEVLDSSSTPVLGIRVDATISGVSGSSSTSETSDSRGIANFCSTGTTTGVDSYSFVANGFTASGTITWTLAVPDISYTPNTVQLATGVAMRTLSPSNAGGLAASWSISPDLPTGLSFSTSTGAITGTPAGDFSNTTYTISATNASGTDTTTVDLSSATAVVPSISYTPSTLSLTLDASTTQTPTVTGTFPTWSISPTLPTGLSINPQNGVVSGTPTRTAAATDYTVTASNSAGSVTTVINLAVVPTLPNISHSPTTYSLYKDVAASAIAPRNIGSPATSWSISPTLPAGLAFNPTNGNISGTPTASSTPTDYTITATNSTGSDTSIISIEVLVSVPAPIIAYSPSTISGQENVVISSLTPTNTGGTSNSWTISPSLPAGLSFNSATGRISGTPTAVSSSATYTVTATNAGGSSTATLTIAVTVAGATAQAITFTLPADKFVAETFASGATADSGLTVTLTSSTTSICTVSGLNITTVAEGTCTIVASQNGGSAGGNTYAAATNVTRTFTVTLRPANFLIAYRIDWATNTGTGYMNPQYGYTNSTAVLDRNLYKKDGYTFAGWNTKADGTGTAYADGAIFKFEPVDVILYAQWKLVQTKPTITWATPASIEEGMALSATQLNALAEVAGTYTYSPAATALLPVGKHTLKVIFVPTEAKYETVETTVEIEILAKAIIIWANPAAIDDATPLSGSQLNATSSVPGTFTYAPAAGALLPAGKKTLKVTFTPTDIRLSAVSAEVSINVTLVIPGAPAAPTFAITGPSKTTVSWGAATNASTYTVSVDGKNACSVAALACDVPKILGPKNVVSVISVSSGGITSAAAPVTYTAPATAQVLTVVNFDSGRAVLKKSEAAKLRVFAAQIKDAGLTTLTVYGHTDSDGGVDNKKLSVSRANSTISYLRKLLPGVKFKVSGFAASEPVADNSTAEGKAANRRAEVFIP